VPTTLIGTMSCLPHPHKKHPLVLRRFVHVHSPAFDYVAPELISLFVTDTGGYTASYVYRLLAEYYSPQDLTQDLLPLSS